ncbi:MAG: GspH/FimT family pseudopilin [Candidatus Liptonbacteria bacterium]
MKRQPGFTLIELLLVVGITIILVGMALPVGLDFYNQYLLVANRDNLVQVLRKARSEAMANINQKPHGVAFLPNQYVLFQGDSYLGRDVLWDQTYDYSGAVNVSSTPEIVFSQLEGASVSSTINLSDSGDTLDILINNAGYISW